jgi:hypothetical protein
MRTNTIAGFGEWLQDFGSRLLRLTLEMTLFVVVILAGLLVAALIRWLTARLLRAVHFDSLAEKTGLTRTLHRAGLSAPASAYAARLAGWLAIFVFVLAGAASIRIPGTASFVDRAFAFVPALVAALLIAVAGVLLAEFVARGVLIAAVNAGWRAARVASAVVRFLILALTTSMTLEQLGVAPTVVVATFSIVLGGAVLALAIAFGLGGRDLAREYLRRHASPPPDAKAGSDLEHL